jgi:hypothetical protein
VNLDFTFTQLRWPGRVGRDSLLCECEVHRRLYFHILAFDGNNDLSVFTV